MPASSYRVVVKPVWRKQIDIDQVTSALLRIVEQMTPEERKALKKRVKPLPTTDDKATGESLSE